jgi:hypothetical protein
LVLILSRRQIILAFSSNDSNLRRDLVISSPKQAGWTQSSSRSAGMIAAMARTADEVIEELRRRKDARGPTRKREGPLFDKNYRRFLVTTGQAATIMAGGSGDSR